MPDKSSSPTLYIMCGLGFSGKSTLAKKIAESTGAGLVSQDDSYFARQKEIDDLSMTRAEQWRFLLEICYEQIRNYLGNGKSVVFDNTNMAFEHRQELRDIAQKFSARTMVIYCNTPDNILLDRQQRSKIRKERHDVEQKDLDQARQQLEIPSAQENKREFKPDTDVNSFLASLNNN